jgi:hypothetical protein
MSPANTSQALNNHHSWQAVRFRNPDGTELDLAIFLEQFGSDTMNTFVPNLLQQGFALMTNPDLSTIISTAPTPDTPAWFDLRQLNKGSLYLRGRDGNIYNVVDAAIKNSDEIDTRFRAAAKANGTVLVIAGTGLNIDPKTGDYDLAPAAAAGLLTAAYIRAAS